jgi:hypothetical protein
VIVPAAIGLAFVRNRVLHTLAFVALIGLYVSQLAGRGLGQ